MAVPLILWLRRRRAQARERMAAQLAVIKGRFLMSINDVPEVREIFAGFEMREVSTSYTIGTKGSSRGKWAELLVANFSLRSADSDV